MSEEKKPWYAYRYGERALPDRGGDHLQHWELDMSPEAVERRERLAKIFRKQMSEDRAKEQEMLREFREKKQEE